jgi:hypothetical protein
MTDKKQTSTSFMLSDESKILLAKLAKIQDRSQNKTLHYLIKKEAKEYGLIEARD